MQTRSNPAARYARLIANMSRQHASPVNCPGAHNTYIRPITQRPLRRLLSYDLTVITAASRRHRRRRRAELAPMLPRPAPIVLRRCAPVHRGAPTRALNGIQDAPQHLLLHLHALPELCDLRGHRRLRMRRSRTAVRLGRKAGPGDFFGRVSPEAGWPCGEGAAPGAEQRRGEWVVEGVDVFVCAAGLLGKRSGRNFRMLLVMQNSTGRNAPELPTCTPRLY